MKNYMARRTSKALEKPLCVCICYVAVNRNLVKKKIRKHQSGFRYEEKNINGPKPSFFATNVILLKLHHHVMIDGVVLSSNGCDPSTIWTLFLPIREPLKIGSVVTLFTRHGCLRFQRQKDRLRPHAASCQKYWISVSCTCLSQTVCGWLTIWCMTQIFLHFKAYRAYLYVHLPEWAPECPKTTDSFGLWEKCALVHTCWLLTCNDYTG